MRGKPYDQNIIFFLFSGQICRGECPRRDIDWQPDVGLAEGGSGARGALHVRRVQLGGRRREQRSVPQCQM